MCSLCGVWSCCLQAPLFIHSRSRPEAEPFEIFELVFDRGHPILLTAARFTGAVRSTVAVISSTTVATQNIVGDEATLFGKAKYVLDGVLNRSWSIDFENKNTSQINYYGLIMTRALAARDLLSTMGVEPRTDGIIYKVYRALNFGFDTKPSTSDAMFMAEKKEAVAGLQKLVNNYLGATNVIE